VCTTELGRAAKLAPKFAELIVFSIDCVEDHLAFSKDVIIHHGDELTKKLPFLALIVRTGPLPSY
jgi:1-Cys peroxiredoxin 6